MNSRGFDNQFPDAAIAAKYDMYNGEFTGEFYFSVEEAEKAESNLKDQEQYSLEAVNDSGWVSGL